ncbi:LysR family transcriptional regulator [Paroceanicella profunda]|uniref:LysR family transcriptional regulator n=1 Tax=Paroceanicella profunda TaxID=2579971 RepID=A0A5B8G3D7_9RHOB|nr:LysR family transcriptional regulator [Paroceanicella profunda]QDL93253.1 LysR family transcriptional regulator [Paroceanicella profunda]
MKRVLFSRFTNYLDEIVRLGSIRRAAEKLHVSPSAIDKQLLRAEQEMGVALFERHPRGVRLTSAGELLMYRVRNWQKDLRLIGIEIEELRGLRRGEVRIAAAQEAVFGLLPQALAAFARESPQITLKVSVGESERVRQMVIDGQADFGLTFSPRPLPGVAVARDIGFQPYALMPDDGSGRRSTTLERFFSRPSIVPDASSHLRDMLDIAAARAGLSITPALTSNSPELMRELVREGCGHGMIALCPAAAGPPGPGIVALPFRAGVLPALTLSLITSHDTAASVAAVLAKQHFELFLDALRERAAP